MSSGVISPMLLSTACWYCPPLTPAIGMATELNKAPAALRIGFRMGAFAMLSPHVFKKPVTSFPVGVSAALSRAPKALPNMPGPRFGEDLGAAVVGVTLRSASFSASDKIFGLPPPIAELAEGAFRESQAGSLEPMFGLDWFGTLGVEGAPPFRSSHLGSLYSLAKSFPV